MTNEYYRPFSLDAEQSCVRARSPSIEPSRYCSRHYAANLWQGSAVDILVTTYSTAQLQTTCRHCDRQPPHQEQRWGGRVYKGRSVLPSQHDQFSTDQVFQPLRHAPHPFQSSDSTRRQPAICISNSSPSYPSSLWPLQHRLQQRRLRHWNRVDSDVLPIDSSAMTTYDEKRGDGPLF